MWVCRQVERKGKGKQKEHAITASKRTGETKGRAPTCEVLRSKENRGGQEEKRERGKREIRKKEASKEKREKRKD